MKKYLFIIALIFISFHIQAVQHINKQLSEFESGKWSVYSTHDVADEEYVLSISSQLPAEVDKFTKSQDLTDIHPKMQIYCVEEYIHPVGYKYRLSIMINWPVMLIHGQKEVTSFFDNENKSTMKWLDNPSASQMSSTLRENNAKNLIKKLLNTKKYIVKTKTTVAKFNKDVLISVEEKDAYIEFDVRGLEKAIKPITNYCPL